FDEEGRAQVSDFGLAKLADRLADLTRTWQLLGTPVYMSPEQAAGKPATVATDVYGLGCVLYFALTGRPPVGGTETAPATARVRDEDPAPLRQANPLVARDLEAVCLKCLEKDPANRYPSAAALADDLARFLIGRHTAARPVGSVTHLWRAVRRRPVMAALVAVAALAVCAVPAVAAWYSLRLEEEALGRQQAELDAARDRELAGTREFFASLERVRVRRLEQPPGWIDASLADIRILARLTPASQHLPDLRSEAAAALAAIDLRPVRTLAEGFKAYAPAYSPDGATLALCGWQTQADGKGVVRLYEAATGRQLRELTFPIDPKWSNRTDRPDGCRSVAFSPDGRWLVAGTRGGQLARWDLDSLDPKPVVWTAHTDDHSDPRRVWVMVLAFAADGGTLYSSCKDSTRAWDMRAGWRPAGPRRDHVIPSGTPVLGGPRTTVRSGTGELYRFDRSGSDAGSLGVTFWNLFAVTRDGRLAAGAVIPGNVLSLVATDPGAWHRPLRTAGRSERLSIDHIGFSPDDALLATSEEHERRVKMWDVASGELATDLLVGKGDDTDKGSLRLAFAPDGRHLVVTEHERAVVYEVAGRVRETLAVGPRWYASSVAVRPDGLALAVLHGDAFGVVELSTWAVPPERTPTLIGRRAFPHGRGWAPAADFSPDRLGFAFTTETSNAARAGECDRIEHSDGTSVECEEVSDLRFAPDGRLWAAAAHCVRIWRLPGWREEKCPLANDAEARDAGAVFRAIAPGRRVSAVGRRDGRVFLLPTGGPTPPPRQVFDSAVTSLALSPDEGRVLVGGERGEVVVLGVADGGRTVLPDAHRDAVWSVAYGPGGWFVTGSADRTIKLWDAAGRLVLTLRAGGGVRKVAVSTDGRLLTVLIDGERAVRRWRLDRLREELTALGLAFLDTDEVPRVE
ncbi:MAG TPA: protein kinase, partial [Fimbriiglobus sp.]|nr:protein kinase [Fimbriiglobus sp.]